TGNVASNLIGRIISAAVADQLGLASNFYFFAVLNLAGAILVYFAVHKTPRMRETGPSMESHIAAWAMHLRNRPLRAAFGIGFCILFAFIGTFTYVNFVLVRPPIGIGMMMLGLVYFVFLPSIITTPFAGRAVQWLGTRPTMWGSARPRDRGPALAARAQPAGRALRHGSSRGRNLLRAGDCNRFRGTRRDHRPRLGQRHLSRKLFWRRPSWQCHARPAVRPARLGGLRRRDSGVARDRNAAGISPQNAG